MNHIRICFCRKGNEITAANEIDRATELGLPLLEHEHARQDARDAIEADYLEAHKRQARELNRATRPSRTIRCEAIRNQLLLNYHKVRLRRNGEWQVQTAPSTVWLLFALSDTDAEKTCSIHNNKGE